MKKILAIGLTLITHISYADVEIVPLDMELGYWETTAEVLESGAIANMLANLPESQRAKVRAMMKSKIQIPIVKQCITSDSFKDFEEKFRNSMGGQESCKFNIQKSTSQEFIGELNCEGNPTVIHTRSINSKRQESEVVSSAGEIGQSKIRTVAEWKSSVCPNDITP
jgi:hypothetical protein